MNIDKSMSDQGGSYRRKVWISVILTLFGGGLPSIYCGRLGAGILLELLLFIYFLILESMIAIFPSIWYLAIMLILGLATFIILIAYNIHITRKTNADSIPKFRLAWLWIIVVFFAGFLVNSFASIFSDKYAVEAYRISTSAMEPTLIPGDYLMATKNIDIDKILYDDIIVFRYPLDTQQNYIKRLIAKGGDKIRITGKQVYRNSELLDEPYVRHIDNKIIPFYTGGQEFPWGIGGRDNMPEIEVPSGKLFVMGDNRDNSADSRFWGFLDDSLVIGRARFIHLSWDSDSSRVRWNRIGMRFDKSSLTGGGNEKK